GAMLLRYPAELREAGLDRFSEWLKALGEADLHRFKVRVGQHQMIEQMREGPPGQREGEILHMGEVGLGHAARLMNLFKHDLTGGTILGTPIGDMSLQGAELVGLIAPRILGGQVDE